MIAKSKQKSRKRFRGRWDNHVAFPVEEMTVRAQAYMRTSGDHNPWGYAAFISKMLRAYKIAYPQMAAGERIENQDHFDAFIVALPPHDSISEVMGNPVPDRSLPFLGAV